MGSFHVKSPPPKMKFVTVPPQILMKILFTHLVYISVFGKVLSEIWALKVLLKNSQNWPPRPIKTLLPPLKFKT